MSPRWGDTAGAGHSGLLLVVSAGSPLRHYPVDGLATRKTANGQKRPVMVNRNRLKANINNQAGELPEA